MSETGSIAYKNCGDVRISASFGCVLSFLVDE